MQYTLTIAKTNYSDTIDKCAKNLAISKKEPLVFKFGNDCVIVSYLPPISISAKLHQRKLKEDYPKQPVIVSLTHPISLLRSRLELEMLFVNEKGNHILCPDDILTAIPFIYGDIPWRQLTGIIEHPYVDNSFNIIQKKGYDENTGLFSVLHNKLKLIDMRVDEAFSYINDVVLAEFPFAEDIDRVVAFAAFMTGLQRPYIGGENGFPGFAITSAKQSSGKTTLAKLIGYSIFNRQVPVTSWVNDDEEMGKQLLSILLEGINCVIFDDLEQGQEIRSKELSRIMTSETYSKRLLGKNQTARVNTNVLWLFTGNNIKIIQDFASRILQIRLIPKIEATEERIFNRNNIAEWALDNRKRTISAIITLILHGKKLKNETGRESRFKNWDRFIRLPLLDITGIDILEAFKNNQADDEQTIAIGNLFSYLYEEYKSLTFKTADILKTNYDSFCGEDQYIIDRKKQEVQELITSAFGQRSIGSNQALGRKLSSVKDLIVNGIQLKKIKIRERVYEWQMILASD